MKLHHRWAATALIVSALGVSTLVHAASVSGQGTWETTLQGRDLDGTLSTFEAYYDTSLNITWLANANYAMTSGYDADGLMNWSTANTWAASLNPYSSGITGWRLPTTVDVGNNGCSYTNLNQGVDCGYNITTHSEMSHLFYTTLGDKAIRSTSGAYQPGYGLTNTGPFSNVQSLGYWSATDYPVDTYLGWIFLTGSGFQGNNYKDYSYYAWAVHAGDVGVAMPASVVPVPAAVWLFSSGLLGLVGMARRKKEVA